MNEARKVRGPAGGDRGQGQSIVDGAGKLHALSFEYVRATARFGLVRLDATTAQKPDLRAPDVVLVVERGEELSVPFLLPAAVGSPNPVRVPRLFPLRDLWCWNAAWGVDVDLLDDPAARFWLQCPGASKPMMLPAPVEAVARPWSKQAARPDALSGLRRGLAVGVAMSCLVVGPALAGDPDPECVAEPVPVTETACTPATPAPAAEATPEPSPEPTPEPSPQPTPEPTPEPDRAPAAQEPSVTVVEDHVAPDPVDGGDWQPAVQRARARRVSHARAERREQRLRQAARERKARHLRATRRKAKLRAERRALRRARLRQLQAPVSLASLPAGMYGSGPRVPAFLEQLYREAGRRFNVPWQILAAINEIETDFGRNVAVSSAGAMGWMQFMPPTWKQYGRDASGDGVADPSNPEDAIFAAARYLDAAGASENLPRAIFAYNHAHWYVEAILLRARMIGDPDPALDRLLRLRGRALERRVLRDERIQIYDCGREDIENHRVDRRVLLTLRFLAESGLHPTVSSLECGHSVFTKSGNISHHSVGAAVDISAINGVPLTVAQGPGSVGERAVNALVTLGGIMKPSQIISLMEMPGVDNTFAMGDHADHIHIGFRPLRPFRRVRGAGGKHRVVVRALVANAKIGVADVGAAPIQLVQVAPPRGEVA